MNKIQKEKLIEKLTTEFENAGAIIACNYQGLSVSNLEELRNSAREKEVKVQVVKNSLANLALNKANLTGLEFKNMNIFIWGNDAISTSKVVSNFAKDSETFKINSAFIDKEIADIEKVEAFAKLPGREELLGMLASVWLGPIRNFTIGLNALKEKKENPESDSESDSE
jgi:large subunit ribosomal protein L10